MRLKELGRPPIPIPKEKPMDKRTIAIKLREFEADFNKRVLDAKEL